MLPAALPPRSGEDLVERLPEAERTVADRQFRRDLQSAPPDIDQEFAPEGFGGPRKRRPILCPEIASPASGVRYIAKPTTLEALFSYRRAA
jgi:hypothetical protein